MAKTTGDKELDFYRDLMEPPTTFEDGFSWSSLIGALFIAMVMVPGSMYMTLMQGRGVGSAAQWVMVLLFIEIAKRTHQSISRPQIFVLFYMAGATMSTPFFGLLFNQYFVRSQAAIGHGMVEQIPIWAAPTDPAVLAQRSFFMLEWLPAIGLILFTRIMGRIDNAILGYGMFKLASDIEKLPFPMAPIGAQGINALAEDLEQTEKGPSSTRWRMFSIGGAIGLIFGFLYLGIPTLSDAFFNTPMQLLPIPFSDWTGKTAGILPAVATGFSYQLGAFLIGTVIPFWAVMGGLAGVLITFALNPILYHADMLVSWNPGDSTVETLFKNRLDFYLSFGLGTSLAIAVIGILMVVHALRKRRTEAGKRDTVKVPKSRGDVPFWLVLLVYLTSTTLYILVSGWLIDWHRGVMTVLLIYGFMFTPLISYATAHLEGMVGQTVEIPFVREVGMIFSGYNGVACWFLPLPLHDYGRETMFYRKAELLGTRFPSLWKTEALLVPIVLVSGIVYGQLIWSMGEIPSAAYPFAEKMWELRAKNQALLFSSTSGGYSQFFEAFKPGVLASGFGAAMLLYGILRAFGAPTFFLFGVIRGLDQTMPHVFFTEFFGALFARFYLEKKFGRKEWRKRAPVLVAGFGCGMGLISIFCIGVKFMKTAVFQVPF